MFNFVKSAVVASLLLSTTANAEWSKTSTITDNSGIITQEYYMRLWFGKTSVFDKEVRQSLKYVLLDSSKALIETKIASQQSDFKDFKQKGYVFTVYCGMINGVNRFGNYTGWKPFYYVKENKHTVIVEEGSEDEVDYKEYCLGVVDKYTSGVISKGK